MGDDKLVNLGSPESNTKFKTTLFSNGIFGLLSHLSNYLFKPFGIPDPTLPLPSPISANSLLAKLTQNSVLIIKDINLSSEEHAQGFFISDNVIVTAGHVANFFRGYKPNVRIRHNTEQGPPEYGGILAKDVYLHSKYRRFYNPAEVDLGLIVTRFPESGKKKIQITPADQIPTPNMINLMAFWGSGGSESVSYNSQYKSRGELSWVKKTRPKFLRGAHTAPTYGRWSGSPMLFEKDNRLELIGVHTSFIVTKNLFCGFTNEYVSDLRQLILQDTPKPNPDLWSKI